VIKASEDPRSSNLVLPEFEKKVRTSHYRVEIDLAFQHRGRVDPAALTVWIMSKFPEGEVQGVRVAKGERA
jgi:hypothetical protein